MAYAKATNREDFAYSIGLIRALETLLLNNNEVERMTLAKDPHEAFRLFEETDYADNIAEVKTPGEFQKVIQEGLKDIKDLLAKITPDERILNIILHQFDFHNIKTMVKGKLGGKSYEELEELLSPLGTIEMSALKSLIIDETDALLRLSEKDEIFVKRVIKEVQELFHKENENPQVIDLYLDEKMMEIIFDIAKDSKSAFLIKYVKKVIDLSNISLFFRIKSQERDFELFELAFLKNGDIPYTKFKEAYKQKLEEFPEIMKSTNYGTLIETGMRHYQEERTLIYLEKEIENHLTSYIKQAKQMAFGPEPLITYFLAKKNNALVARMIMINKLNNVDPEEIKRRLRDLYA